jgi:hypothetical protein
MSRPPVNDWIPAISPVDRTVPLVELRRLTPIEREEDRQRRERQRRRKAEKAAPEPPSDGGLGIDIRA